MEYYTMKNELVVDVICDPMAELPLRTAKFAGLCLDLYLGKKSITQLGNDFRFFVSLETLWLNNNYLTSVR